MSLLNYVHVISCTISLEVFIHFSSFDFYFLDFFSFTLCSYVDIAVGGSCNLFFFAILSVPWVFELLHLRNPQCWLPSLRPSFLDTNSLYVSFLGVRPCALSAILLFCGPFLRVIPLSILRMVPTLSQYISPPLTSRIQHKIIFRLSLTGLNSDFSSSYNGCHTKVKKPTLP